VISWITSSQLCTTGTIGLPDPNQRSVVKTPEFLHPYIYTHTARVPRDRFLAFEGEGMTGMRQPSWQGIALFSVRMEFWRSTATGISRAWHTDRTESPADNPTRSAGLGSCDRMSVCSHRQDRTAGRADRSTDKINVLKVKVPQGRERPLLRD
jgi:hypothetical protein